MTTRIRPELSEKNEYWIERHRYYELKHFCLQYPIWKKACQALDGLSKQPMDLALSQSTGHGDPTVRCAEAREMYQEQMKLVEQAAIATDADLGDYILKAVTDGISYDGLKMRFNIPCSKDVYYELYRKFFWLLSKNRK